MKTNKTLWQRFYSFFGFWTYTEIVGNDKAYLVIYWLCFPFWFIRKFDVWRMDISKTKSLNAQREALKRKIIEKGESLEDYSWLFSK